MRSLAAILLSPVVLLAACASPPWAPSTAALPACEFASVPPGAVFGVRHGVDTATYPPGVSRGFTGCQRVWFGDRQRPQAMQVLATYHFEQGHVRRLVGRVPDGAGYDCHYRDGVLDAARSQNPAQCPKASEVDPR
ncbi:MAG TPA: hypothetical protein VGD76_17590 [Ramlibacter sp.]